VINLKLNHNIEGKATVFCRTTYRLKRMEHEIAYVKLKVCKCISYLFLYLMY